MKMRRFGTGIGTALAVGFSVALAIQGNVSAGQNPPAAGGGQGGRGGGRGFNLPPLLMETDAFPDGGIVPQKFVGRGGVQPGFKFSNAPAGTVAYAIIFHDLDVALQGGTGDVLHWMAWNIPASANGIPEGSLPAGIGAGQQHHRPAKLHGTGCARRPAIPPLRLRALRAQRSARPARDREPRRPAQGDAGQDGRQGGLCRPLPPGRSTGPANSDR